MESSDPLRKYGKQGSAGVQAVAIAVLLLLGLFPFLSILASGHIVFASDQIGAPAWKFFFDALRHGHIPLWNPYALSGMPTFDAGFGDGSYPPFLILGSLLPIRHVVTYSFVLHVLIAGLSAYVLVRRFFQLERPASVALAAAYMLNTNFISHIHAGHTGKFYIMAWLPLSIFFLLRCLGNATRWFHLVGLALTITLFISTSHLQFTYYVLMGYFLVWALKTYGWVKEKRMPMALAGAGKFWLPILLGLGMGFPVFYPPIQYNKEFSVRGEGEHQTYEHATSWSMHPEETASLIVPEFTGLNEKYWGRNPFKLNSEYPGLAVLFLGIFGLAAFRRKWLWFWAALGLLSIIYGLGAHTFFFRIFYNVIPGLKNFRAPSMMLFWLATALLMMSAQTLAIVFREVPAMKPEKRNRIAKRLLQWGFGAAGLLLVCGIASAAVYSLWDSIMDASQIGNIAQQAGNASDFSGGAVKNAVLLAALVFGLWKWGFQASKPMLLSLMVGAVACIDLYMTNRNFIQGYEPDRFFPEEQAVDYLKQQPGPFRVFGLPGAYERGYMQFHGISYADGFVDNESRIYRSFRGEDYRQNPNFMNGLRQNPDGSVSGSNFLDMLNVKYLAFRLQNDPGLKLAENKSALPRAWFVDRWETRPDSLALPAMLDSAFKPARFAYVSTTTPVGDAPAAANDSAAAAAIKEKFRDTDRIIYQVHNAGKGLLVMSEVYFPHWHAVVDGKKQAVARVDYALQGVALEPGDHQVELRYDSPWIQKGMLVAGACLIALIAGAAGFHLAGRSRRAPVPTPAPAPAAA